MVKTFIVVTAAFCFAATGAFAIVSNAPISWDAPATISGDTDVSTDGSLVAAFDMIGSAVTVNGVPFASFPATSLTTSTTDGNFSFTESPGHLIADTNLGSSQSPFSTLSSNYKTLLSSALDTDENNTLTLTISGLVVGQQYEFQWWDNNSSIATAGRNSTTATAGNSVTLQDNTTNAMGGVGQTVIGTFTAVGSTETIAFSGINSSNSPTVNAFELRAVPEPGSLALISLGTLLVAGILRRRS